MDWMAALRARATGDGTLAALISTRADWAQRKQSDPLPALTFLLVSDERPQHLKGFDGLLPSRVQVDSYAKTHKAAWTVAEAALSALVSGGTFSGHKFSRAIVDLPPRDFPETVGTETVFRVSMDLLFHHAPDEDAS